MLKKLWDLLGDSSTIAFLAGALFVTGFSAIIEGRTIFAFFCFALAVWDMWVIRKEKR